ncbi:MAG: hypothetical protein ABI678_18065, partial [Kofleriaceae bacterium]
AWCPAEVLDLLVALARLGLTATPPDEGGALERTIGPVVYSLSVADLVGDALAAYDLSTLPVRLDHAERATYREARGVFNVAYARFLRRQPGAAWAEFVRHAAVSADGRIALAAWRASRCSRFRRPSGSWSASSSRVTPASAC